MNVTVIDGIAGIRANTNHHTPVTGSRALPPKLHIRHCILYEFQQPKTIARDGEDLDDRKMSISSNSPETALAASLIPCVSLLARQRKKNYLWKIVTGDEKWIMYNNRKCTHSWVDPGQPTTSTPERPSVHLVGYKTCAVLLTPLPGETVTTECYFRQLIKLLHAMEQKRPFTG
uniref:WW domain-containing protein n=1 Tax=Heterorhabditis bacteriophora TaxID=37862 RepID=A0A1I7WI42_HETBA